MMTKKCVGSNIHVFGKDEKAARHVWIQKKVNIGDQMIQRDCLCLGCIDNDIFIETHFPWGGL